MTTTTLDLERDAIARTCEAQTNTVPTAWGFRRESCHASRGLRSFVDGNGVTHYACPAHGHMADVVRRFGAMPLGDAIDAVQCEGEARAMWGNR